MESNNTVLPALIVKQWLNSWNGTNFLPAPPRGKPAPHFYLFTIDAVRLKRLSGVMRRNASIPPDQDQGIQRRHDVKRSDEILRYVNDGFPLSRIDRRKLVDPSEANDLRMPGWLPSAIIANILRPGDVRGADQRSIQDSELIKIDHFENTATISLPLNLDGQSWVPSVFPIEIIDGQHRLWAFEEKPIQEDLLQPINDISEFQIPVVAFHGLDRTWQAYLFYTINQLPKRIDQSLVYDLYPLLRTQEWLQRFEGPNVYRENRAQALTIALWGHPESPWRERIARFGGIRGGQVAQASFVRNLTATFVKTYRTQLESKRIGGLFGSPQKTHLETLGWSFEQQAAFLIICWQELEKAVRASTAVWTKQLRKDSGGSNSVDAAFSGDKSLIATDQGVRAFMGLINDAMVVAHSTDILKLDRWGWEPDDHEDEEYIKISSAIANFRKSQSKAHKVLIDICKSLAKFDWRLSSAIDRDRETEAFYKASAYRGSGGYVLLKQNLLLQSVPTKSNVKALVDMIIGAEELEGE